MAGQPLRITLLRFPVSSDYHIILRTTTGAQGVSRCGCISELIQFTHLDPQSLTPSYFLGRSFCSGSTLTSFPPVYESDTDLGTIPFNA